MISPLTKKRFLAFKRNRRAWWALMAFGAIFVFCLAAEWVCPCDPQKVVSVEELEPYCACSYEYSYDVRTARFSVADDGTVFDYEGPEEMPKDCRRIEKRRAGYTRIFLEPLSAPKLTRRELPAKEVSFPFHPCPGHPFGIDAGGRDVYARVVYGMRIALVFGLVLALSGVLFGVAFGAIQGYFAGWVDIFSQRITEIWSAIPFIYVMIFIGSTLGRSFTLLLLCYAIFNWIIVSYYIRAEFLRLRSRTFVESAKLHGFSAWRIVFVHILPNAMTPLITLFPFLLMGAIGSLAALDFLGFGLPPMTPSCGELLAEAQQFRGAWWLVLFPSAALFVVMFLTVLVGEGLRDAFDPRRVIVYR